MENNIALDYMVKDLSIKTGFKPDKILSWLTAENPLTPEEILNNTRVVDVLNQSPSPLTTEDIVPERLEEKILEKNAPSTGYQQLDEILKGFIPGRLYTLSGDTNIGKTSLSANFAVAVAKQDRRVLYLALEPGNTIIDYLACITANKRFEDIVEEDYHKVSELGIMYYKNDTINSPEGMIKALREQERYDLVIIDHIGYFTMSEKSPTARESNVVKQMVQIAKEKRCAIVQIRHLKKPDSIKKRLPNINDITGSAAFKQDATEVIIAFRESDETDKYGLSFKNTGQILVYKTKSGKNGRCPITFMDSTSKIIERIEPLPKFRPF